MEQDSSSLFNHQEFCSSSESKSASLLQLTNMSMEYDPLYDADKGMKVMPSSFHDIGDVEFQDNWGRFWYNPDQFPFLHTKTHLPRISIQIFFYSFGSLGCG